MKQVWEYQELLEYLNRLGLIQPKKPIGWRQQELCTLADKIVSCAKWKVFPIKVHYYKWKTSAREFFYFSVDGHKIAIPVNLKDDVLNVI